VKLAVFDLDQTLVDLVWLHNRAAEAVFQRWFGVSAQATEVDSSGRSLDDILREVSRRRGFSTVKVEAEMPAMLEAYHRVFLDNLCGDSLRCLLPGVPGVLDALIAAGALVGLYTGNSPAVGAAILEATGIGHYFRYRQFGTEVPVRSDMLRRIIRDIARDTGRVFGGKELVVLGDSARDVAAGLEMGARVVGVATGFYPVDELKRLGADVVFKDMGDTAAVSAAVCGPLDARPGGET
jgi:phosphoglycolate phosphatase-like HAD superfamily hydrolase